MNTRDLLLSERVNRQYIGARYVIKVYENSVDEGSAEWEAATSYEPFTLVTYQNSSYLSKKAVPASIGNPATNPRYWVVTGAYNGQIANLQHQIDMIKKGFVTPEMFGAVGDGIADDTTAITNAIRNGLVVVGDITKTYKVTSTIAIINSFSLKNMNLYMPSSDTLKELFLVNANNLLILMDNVTFYSDMDKPSVSFTDTQLSSNILFYHCNEFNSDLYISNSIIKNCEYCLKAEIGGMYISNCKLVNSMMPIFTNTTKLNLLDSKVESVATNELYHCVYIHPYEISDDGHIDNCEFISKVNTSLQCYNSDTIGEALENFYVSNSTFKDNNGELTAAFSYNECKIHFNHCELIARYKGYYNDCKVKLASPLQDIDADSCECRLANVGAVTDAKLLVKNSKVIFEAFDTQNINLLSGTLDFVNNYINILNTHNAIRAEAGTINILDNIVLRDSSIDVNIANMQGGTFNFIDNKYKCVADDIDELANIDLTNPTRNFSGTSYTTASDVVTSDTGFYDFHCKVYPARCDVSFNSRLKTWRSGDIVGTFRNFITPAFSQYAIGVMPQNNGVVVLRINTDRTIEVLQIEASSSDTTIYAGFSLALA